MTCAVLQGVSGHLRGSAEFKGPAAGQLPGCEQLGKGPRLHKRLQSGLVLAQQGTSQYHVRLLTSSNFLFSAVENPASLIKRDAAVLQLHARATAPSWAVRGLPIPCERAHLNNSPCLFAVDMPVSFLQPDAPVLQVPAVRMRVSLLRRDAPVLQMPARTNACEGRLV